MNEFMAAPIAHFFMAMIPRVDKDSTQEVMFDNSVSHLHTTHILSADIIFNKRGPHLQRQHILF